MNTQPRNDGQNTISFAFDAQDNSIEISEENSIEINITNWITNATNGTYNILLRYEDIDGYWDGAWVIPVELNPLVIRGNNVGIGTDDPAARLHVNGDVKIESDKQIFFADNGQIKSADDNHRIRLSKSLFNERGKAILSIIQAVRSRVWIKSKRENGLDDI